MVFGIVADLIASVVTILFPIFASYKALQTSDPAQLTPWLMYWVVLSLILLAESYTVFIIGWLPFYSWIRLILLSYLVLPQTQGAKLLYQSYISPFIFQHETEIETFIANAHERAVALGLKYLKQAIELFRQHVLGFPPSSESEAPQQQQATQSASYAQSLLSRFSIPTARPPATSDIYGMLSSAVAAATGSGSGTSGGGASAGRSREAQINHISDSGMLYPKDVSSGSSSEKLSFLESQRENLRAMLSVVDRAAQKERGDGPGDGGVSEREIEADVERRLGGPLSGVRELKKNTSEQSFDAIDPDEARNGGGNTKEKEKGVEGGEKPKGGRRTASAGWGGWFGGGSGGGSSAEDAAAATGQEAGENSAAATTGFEKGS
ncbi:MAG: hypothetical protein Q9160_001346 [Pyrenula sp. 1 TL-2023]